MITLSQEICCLDCKYAHFYFSNINSCLTSYLVKQTATQANGAVVVDIQRNINP